MSRWDIVEKHMQRREIKNISELAKISGVPYTTIRSMKERDFSNASIDHTIKICRTLGITVDELVSLEKEIEETFEFTNMNESYKPLVLTNTDEIVFYEDIELSNIPLKPNIRTDELLDTSNRSNTPIEIKNYNLDNRNFYQLKVTSESMNRIIPPYSQITVIPTKFEDLKDGDIIIFNLNRNYRIRRFRKDEIDEVLIFSPESYNKKFRDIILPYKEIQDIQFYGKIINYTVMLD